MLCYAHPTLLNNCNCLLDCTALVLIDVSLYYMLIIWFVQISRDITAGLYTLFWERAVLFRHNINYSIWLIVLARLNRRNKIFLLTGMESKKRCRAKFIQDIIETCSQVKWKIVIICIGKKANYFWLIVFLTKNCKHSSCTYFTIYPVLATSIS